jgi:hypothetical protein
MIGIQYGLKAIKAPNRKGAIWGLSLNMGTLLVSAGALLVVGK